MPITDIHSITGYHLKDIRVIADENEYGGEEYLEILFLVEGHVLHLVPLPDTDEIHAEVIPVGNEEELIPLSDGHWMRELVGLKVGYVWTCTNSQGYGDLIVLSFEDLVPNLAVLCQCSTLRILRMSNEPHRLILP